MANLSDLTRKEQVLAYLRERRNRWVDGPELATEAVGGSEGLRRLRELRLSGDHDIRERRHPDPQRDIWQYMLVLRAEPLYLYADEVPDDMIEVPIEALDLGAFEFDYDDTKPAYPDAATEAARREEEAAAAALLDLPIPDESESPWPADHGQTRISDAVRRKEDGTFEYVPPQRPLMEQPELLPEPEQPVGDKYTSMPKKISWGGTAVCPRCRMKTTRGRKPKPRDETEPEHIRQRKQKKQAGPKLIDDDGILLYRDPYGKEPRPCLRCNGYGIVPNQGPIPITMPEGPGKPEPVEEAKTMELDL